MIAALALAIAAFGWTGCSNGSGDDGESDTGTVVQDTDIQPDVRESDVSGDDATAGGCETDDDCTSEETPFCAEYGECAECLEDGDCASGNCANDAEPYECACVETGESCESDGACCSGNCGGGTCKSESCGDVGASCESSTDCCGTNVCNTETNECAECASESESCKEVECCGDLTCMGTGTGGGGGGGEVTETCRSL
jgi:hypothetical protein